MLSLVSVKSCYGHTEGTAGITGLLLALGASQQQLLPPVVNLRDMNPYVAAALGGFSSSGNGSKSGVAIPRQAAANGSSAEQRLAGTSSFGMSGVNAHALLLTASNAPSAADAHTPLPWQPVRHWPIPQQHRLLQLPRLAAPSSVRFAASLTGTPALHYCWDHVIYGRPLLAGAVALEMAGAAAAMFAEGASPALPAAVADAAFVAPCLLPSLGSSRALVLEAAVESISGSLAAQAAAGASLSTILTARAAELASWRTLPAAAPAQASASSTRLLALLLPGSASSADAAGASAVSCARICAPSHDATAAYHQHPAAGDACLHISALVSQMLDGHVVTSARIPVAAGLCASRTGLPSSIASGGSAGGWAAVKVSGRDCLQRGDMGMHCGSSCIIAACLSVLHCRPLCHTPLRSSHPLLQVSLLSSSESETNVNLTHRGSAGSAPRAFSLAGLLARDVSSKQQQHQQSAAAMAVVQQQAAADQLLYTVQWQAEAAHANSPVPARLPLLSTLLPSGSQVLVGSTTRKFGLEHLLQALQSSESSGLHSAKQWLLGTASSMAAGAPAPAADSRQAAADGAAAASLHGLLKVAASEQLLAPDAEVVLGGPALPATTGHASSRQFGVALRAGTMFGPRLLPASRQAAAAAAAGTGGSFTTLITGGLGGLGLLTAGWLQQANSGQPGTSLVLLGRSGRSMDSRRSSGGDTAGAAALTTAGASSPCLVRLVRCDVAASEEAAAAVAAAARQHAVGSLLHAGGVLADALLLNQTAASLRAVAAPKVAGLQQLSAAAAGQPLVQMLLFSSIAGELGTAGQGNYAAANAALDAAAANLQQTGLASASVQWGAWAGAGMAAASPALLVRLQRKGYEAVQPAAGLTALHGLMAGSGAGAAVVMAAPFDWSRFLAPAGRRQTWQSKEALPYFAAVQPAAVQEPALAPAPAVPAAAVPAPSLSAEAVLPIVQQLLEEQLGSSAAALDVALDAPFLEAGLDSIGAVELR